MVLLSFNAELTRKNHPYRPERSLPPSRHSEGSIRSYQDVTPNSNLPDSSTATLKHYAAPFAGVARDYPEASAATARHYPEGSTAAYRESQASTLRDSTGAGLRNYVHLDHHDRTLANNSNRRSRRLSEPEGTYHTAQIVDLYRTHSQKRRDKDVEAGWPLPDVTQDKDTDTPVHRIIKPEDDGEKSGAPESLESLDSKAPCGFWDESLNGVRRQVFKSWCKTSKMAKIIMAW